MSAITIEMLRMFQSVSNQLYYILSSASVQIIRNLVALSQVRSMLLLILAQP